MSTQQPPGDKPANDNTYHHDADALKNLSYMVGHCHNCGTQTRDTVQGEVDEAWSYCNECGHLVKVANRTRWN